MEGGQVYTEYDYDLAGNPVAVYAGRETAAKKAAAQRLTYDARCNITGVGDGNHNRTEFVLDAWGRITEIHTPEGGVERYTYDYAGNITGTEDANGGIVTYRYNSLGQVYEITDQEGNTESFYCDKEGRRETYLSSYELLIQHEQYKIFIDLLEYIDYLREQEEKIFLFQMKVLIFDYIVKILVHLWEYSNYCEEWKIHLIIQKL